MNSVARDLRTSHPVVKFPLGGVPASGFLFILNILIILIILILLNLLNVLIPSPALGAERVIPDRNTLGVYWDEGALQNSWFGASPYSTANVYVVIWKPFNEIRKMPITHLAGIEFSLTVNRAVVLDTQWPGEFKDEGEGELNHIVTFAEPVAVVDDLATVATLAILYTEPTGTVAADIYLAPASPSSAAGFMVCRDDAYPADICPLTPPYGTFDFPVFCINCDDPIEQSSLSAIKALYR